MIYKRPARADFTKDRKVTFVKSTENVLDIHWKIFISYSDKSLRIITFNSSQAFLKWSRDL